MDPDFQNNQPGQTQQPGFQPTVPTPSNLPGQDSSSPTQQPANPGSYGGDLGSNGDDKTKKLLIIVAALIGFFVIIAIIVLALNNGDNVPADQTQENVTGDFYVEEPSAVDVESVNNSISDNISGMDTDADFPEDNLNDLNLGL